MDLLSLLVVVAVIITGLACGTVVAALLTRQGYRAHDDLVHQLLVDLVQGPDHRKTCPDCGQTNIKHQARHRNKCKPHVYREPIETPDRPSKPWEKPKKTCFICTTGFRSRNALFRHLRANPSHRLDPRYYHCENHVVYS